MDDFNKSIVDVLEWFGDRVVEGCETFAQEVEAIADEVEAAVGVCLEPVFSWLDELDEVIVESSRPLVQMAMPTLQNHPACVGCCHYHGQTYGDHLLVCAMHPYGPADPKCLDWESVWGEH